MAVMHLKEYRDRVLGCWLGKNIGGTLGAPLECLRGVFDVDFYTQKLGGEPLPNDDLDLQLVWLNAAEEYGRAVNASVLGEYWQTYITPNWSEYGIGKSNLRMGLVPPLSGYVGNNNRDSCGAFIRSELWACLMPGHPELAVRYAYEDAIVDHSHEGVYGEVFFAAIQSAAFVEHDRDTLIDIGLSYLPADCGIRRGIDCVRSCYAKGMDWKAARRAVLQCVPGSFGMLVGYQDRAPEEDIPVGPLGYDAPSNVAITVLGWLYGENDFARSLCIAVGCGEDADCTAATLGAILGIIQGAQQLPQKWIEPLGHGIVTCSINAANGGITLPKTVDALTERVLRLAPQFLGSRWCDVLCEEPGYAVTLAQPEMLFEHAQPRNQFYGEHFSQVLACQPFAARWHFPLFDAVVDLQGEPYVRAGEPFSVTVKLENCIRAQQWLTLKWHLPAGWQVLPSPVTALSLLSHHGSIGLAQAAFTILPGEPTDARYDLVLAISSQGRHSQGLIPVTLLQR
ncbi:MAG: ADP-ribosylglycohydrolase family protein [Eubacteriales bacterium]|nr:ADP-ribosylglycohydrolase family protein [Eubacteriales bacterium]